MGESEEQAIPARENTVAAKSNARLLPPLLLSHAWDFEAQLFSIGSACLLLCTPQTQSNLRSCIELAMSSRKKGRVFPFTNGGFTSRAD